MARVGCRSRAEAPPGPAPRELDLVEQVTLFVSTMFRDRANELLDGFVGPSRDRARAFSARISKWDSPTRQARLTREFGQHPDAGERVRRLILEASPPLRRAIVSFLPEALADGFPHLRAPGVTEAPALRALAARLVREATRA